MLFQVAEVLNQFSSNLFQGIFDLVQVGYDLVNSADASKRDPDQELFRFDPSEGSLSSSSFESSYYVCYFHHLDALNLATTRAVNPNPNCLGSSGSNALGILGTLSLPFDISAQALAIRSKHCCN